jgi:uncharacterized peroxidase-related enzyme
MRQGNKDSRVLKSAKYYDIIYLISLINCSITKPRRLIMTFIKSISEEQAENLVLEQYQAAQKSIGYVPNYIKTFSLHPEVYDAWTKLIGEIRSKMRMRRYELVTLAAAMTLECTYCMLAHGAILRKNFFNVYELTAIVKDFRNAGLPPEEVALMSFAQKIITNAHQINEDDIDELRKQDLTDEEILDVVLACTARSFFSKTLDALDAKPDEIYLELEPELIQELSLGRPFSSQPL